MPHRKSFLFFLITILSGLLFYSLTGQSGKTAAPSDQAREIQKAIDKTQSLLSESKKEKQQWFKKLELLQSQISYRRELQEELRLQLESINLEIDRLQKQNESQVAQLRLHQRKYAQSLKNKLINRLTFNPVLSLMQPASLDRQVKQWYIRDQLEARRMQTLRTMQDWKNQYEQSLEKLRTESAKKDSLLVAAKNEETSIGADLQQVQKLVQDFHTRESSLNSELVEYKKQKDKLSAYISESISKLPAASSNTRERITGKFMRYPLRSSTIVSRFGKNMESGNPNLVVRNNGIDLQSEDPFVQAAMSAEVVQIRKMPNQNYLLITRSDHLYAVYSNLNSVLLRTGERVEAGGNIGKAAKNENGYYELHFETWLGKNPQNPLNYLR